MSEDDDGGFSLQSTPSRRGSFQREKVELDEAKVRNASLINDDDAAKFCVR